MISENDLVGKGFPRAVGECCVSTEGGWEGFLEEVTFLLAWSREATPSRGNSKCKVREDSSRVSGGGRDSLTSKARPCAAVVSARTRLPVLELQLCCVPAG